MNYFAKLTISLLSTSRLIPQSWKTTSARTTSIVVFDLKAALWSCVRHQWNNFIVKHCVVRIHADRGIVFVRYSWYEYEIDTWLLREMQAKIRTVQQAQVALSVLVSRLSPTTDSEGEVICDDQGHSHSCLVYGFLLRLLSCESRIQRKGKKVG